MHKIFITGDTHSTLDIDSISQAVYHDLIGEGDYLIIAGDCGCCWSESQDEKTLSYFENLPCTVLFVDGNHENFEKLNSLPVISIGGGQAHQVASNVYHLMRGYVFQICGKTFFTMGGATSIDKHLRINRISWWEEEMPNYEEFERGLKNLEKHNNCVDYIVTHSAPSDIMHLLCEYYDTDNLTDYLEEIRNNCEFKKWFFGHYHTDHTIHNKYFALYNTIIEVD